LRAARKQFAAPAGEKVVIAATDTGVEPVEGELYAATADRISIVREDARAGRVAVHFPRLGFELRARPCTQPHVEDRKAMRAAQSLGRIGHPELVGCLRSAEVARSTGELFGCALRSNPSGSGAAWVNPKEAARSICGCEFRFLRFFWRVDRWRVEVKLAGGETLKSLPIVDRDWNDFLDVAGAALGNVNREQRLHRFLNGRVAREIDQDEARFIRLGLTRTNDQGVCWLMLDSLFPLPRQEWVAELGESRGSNEKA